MHEEDVRRHAQEACEALLAGNVDRVVGSLSDELRRNAGEVVGLLPLPVTEAEITSVEQNGKTFVVGLHLVGETDTVELQTRWKERDGQPTIVEASHLSRTATEPALEGEDEAASEELPA